MKKSAGFSLLEVLVAFSILAIALGVLMQIFSGSLRNVDISRQQAQATGLAQSLLAGAGVETPLTAGESSGNSEGGYAWRLSAAPYQGALPGADAGAAPIAPPLLELWEVKAEVSWDDGPNRPPRRVNINSLRVQAPAGS